VLLSFFTKLICHVSPVRPLSFSLSLRFFYSVLLPPTLSHLKCFFCFDLVKTNNINQDMSLFHFGKQVFLSRVQNIAGPIFPSSTPSDWEDRLKFSLSKFPPSLPTPPRGQKSKQTRGSMHSHQTKCTQYVAGDRYWDSGVRTPHVP